MSTRTRGHLQLDEPESLPLCRHYAAVFFSRLGVEVRGDAGSVAVEAGWVLGWLADGQSEVIGVWSTATSYCDCWVQALDDLERRGVERISVVLVGEPHCAGSFGIDEFAAPASKRGRRALSFAVSDVPAGRSRKLVVGDRFSSSLSRVIEVGRQVGRRTYDYVGRAVRRHGAFESELAVRSFCASKLQSLHFSKQLA